VGLQRALVTQLSAMALARKKEQRK
jgi:hypothetical protein